MMLDELGSLLQAVPGVASRRDYSEAVMEDNCLAKRTVSTRALTLQRLTELYALDPKVLLFRMLRDLWAVHANSRPLLALIVALARDPLLRATARSVVATPVGHEFARQPMRDDLEDAVGDRLNGATLDKVIRNASSSWSQSGHLRGRGRKVRQRVVVTPAATTLALVLGFATSRRGRSLFDTPWAAVLDAGVDELIDLAVEAKRLGLLDLKQSASIVEVTFPMLFTDRERGLISGTH